MCGKPRNTSPTFTLAEALLVAKIALPCEGRAIMSYPVPDAWSRLPFKMPYMIPTMDRIIMTSIATASALISERSGR